MVRGCLAASSQAKTCADTLPPLETQEAETYSRRYQAHI